MKCRNKAFMKNFPIRYYHVILIMSCFIYTIQGSGGIWLNSNDSSTTFQSIKLTKTSNPANQTEIYQGRIGETSGDIYIYGYHRNDTTYSFIARMTDSFSYVWYKLYTPRGSFYTFDVSPTEDFFYFWDYAGNTSSEFRLYKGDATNGDIVLSFNLTSFWTEYKAYIGITPSNDALYMNTDSYESNTTHKLIIMRYHSISNQTFFTNFALNLLL